MTFGESNREATVIRRRWVLRVLALGLLTCTAACAADPLLAPDATATSEVAAAEVSAQIEAMLDRYFKAVETKDLMAFQALLADPATFTAVTPTGRLQSPEDLNKFFLDLQSAYRELHLTRSNVATGTEGSAAWAAFDWELKGVFANGSRAAFTGWETQIYRRTADGWRIAHVHYSVPLVVPTAQ
jgi:ketosteroid isomerase-like protein